MTWQGQLLRGYLVPAAEFILGRRNLVRLSRLVQMEARLDVGNDMASNGELLLQRHVLQNAASAPLVVFDVGANIGEWSAALLEQAQPHQLQLHLFEPASVTYSRLCENMQAPRPDLFAINQALSDHVGEDELVIAGAGLGTNSLHGDRSTAQTTEKVRLNTLDNYCQQAGIAHIDFIKIDAEGHDMAVLRGGEKMFSSRAIDLAQFEYNQRWIGSRHFLKDAFDLLQPFGYHIGKVTPRGIEFYKDWHFELESLREGNYLACLPKWFDLLPKVKWWNE